MNRILIVLTVTGTLLLPNPGALAQSKGHRTGPPAGAGSSVTQGIFGSISQVGVITVPPVIPMAALIAIPTAPGLAGTAPGLSGGNPGHGGSPPGQIGTSPGLFGNAPGQIGSSPGHSGNAPGQIGTAKNRAGPPSNSFGHSRGKNGSASGSGNNTTDNGSPSDSGATQAEQQAAGGQFAEAKQVSWHLIPSCK